jgi:hypothetical protein
VEEAPASAVGLTGSSRADMVVEGLDTWCYPNFKVLSSICHETNTKIQTSAGQRGILLRGPELRGPSCLGIV